MVKMIFVYCPDITPRSEYVFRTFFSLGGISQIEFISDEKVFHSRNGIKINYSKDELENSVRIIPCGLLNETGVKDWNPVMEKWNATNCFFKTSEEKIPFDVFSATFWLLSRYEEYLPFKEDEHSRYSGKNSFLFKSGMLLRPLIDEWISEVFSILTIPKQAPKITKTLTIDVDNAFAFKHKDFVRSVGGSIRNLIKRDFSLIADRRKVLSGKMKDPFDTYDYIIETAEKNAVDLKFFFLLGDRGKYDTNLSHDIKGFQEKIRALSEKSECGIHPSYQSFLDKNKVKDEISRLEKITGKKVRISRQHFLRMRLPESYRILIDYGITEDHTMGFADEPGYRAGTSRPFFWYDLKDEKTTSLKIHPFVMMDATLRRYLSLSPEQAIEYSQKLYDSLKVNGGEFTLLWHNESVGDYWKWKGWKQLFEAQMMMR